VTERGVAGGDFENHSATEAVDAFALLTPEITAKLSDAE